MKSIQVCLSPALINLYSLEQTTVVVTDVLRATSTMIAALELGVKHIIPVASREEALTYVTTPDTLVAGERDGKKVEGFHLGNSPLVLQTNKELIKGKQLVITTTNGTKAIDQSSHAKEIYIGALSNVQALANHLKHNTNDILIVCAGWKNRVNMEDTLFAGALLDCLQIEFSIKGDAAIMSHQLYQANRDGLFTSIQKATHYKRLKDHGIEDDIKYCMTENSSQIVAKVKNGKIITV